MNYNFNEWNVKLIQEPNELMETLKNFNLKGKIIKNIRLVGMCYNLNEDEATDVAYKYYDVKNIELNEESFLTYESIPDEVEFNRYAQIDEPIIIEFDDGDSLEIDYSEASSLKIGLNSLPKNIQYGCNFDNVDGNILFSNCIGEQIIGYEVLMQDEFELTYTCTGSHGILNPINQESYISGFKILLTNCLEIHFNSWYDYGEVIVVIRPNDYSKITWKELKCGIKEFKEKTNYNEQEIVDGIYNETIDISRIDFLLKNGADVNAQVDKEVEDGHILDSLFQTIVYNCNSESKINLVEILKCFIKNGLDINKFGSSIISDFHFLSTTNQDIYKMTKIILNNTTTKINVEDTQNGIEGESSWLICSHPDDYVDNPDAVANTLDGLYELLEKYEKDENYNVVFDCKHIIGQKFKNIYLSGNFKVVNQNTIEYKYYHKNTTQLYTLIECEKDSLLVKENYLAYVDNDSSIIGENEFTKRANEYLNGEIIENIEFKHYNNRFGAGRTCEIYFSNNKKIIYGTREDDITEYLELI